MIHFSLARFADLALAVTLAAGSLTAHADRPQTLGWSSPMWVYQDAEKPKSGRWVKVNMSGKLMPAKLEFDQQGAVARYGPPPIALSDTSSITVPIAPDPALVNAWRQKSADGTGAGRHSTDGMPSQLGVKIKFEEANANEGASLQKAANEFVRKMDPARFRLSVVPKPRFLDDPTRPPTSATEAAQRNNAFSANEVFVETLGPGGTWTRNARPLQQIVQAYREDPTSEKATSFFAPGSPGGRNATDAAVGQ